MRRRSLLLVMLAMVMALTACGGGATNSAPAATETAPNGVLKVGMEAGYPPFNWTQMDDSNGAVQIDGSNEYANGYDVQIAKKLAEGMGKELVIVKTSWDGLPPSVQAGSVDAIIAGMTPTAERREALDFSEPYYYTEYVVVTLADGPYANATSISDFAGAKVTGQLGTNHYDKLVWQMEGAEVDAAMTDFQAMRVALEAGTIDAYVSEIPDGTSAEAANPNFKMIRFEEGNGFDISLDDSVVAVGLKKGSPLKAQMDEILAGISKEEMNEIMLNAVETQPANN